MTCGTPALALPAYEAILALLQAIAPGPPPAAYLGVYENEVGEAPLLDADGRVRPYCVLQAGTGDPIGDNLAGGATAQNYQFGVAVAGGDQWRAVWARDRVVTALVGARLVIPDAGSGVIHAGPFTRVIRDDDSKPPRHVAALLFNVLTTLPEHTSGLLSGRT